MPSFSNYLGIDFPITLDFLDDYDALQYYFITDYLGYEYITDLQLMMRFSIKLDYAYSDMLTPVIFLGWKAKMDRIEEQRKKDREAVT